MNLLLIEPDLTDSEVYKMALEDKFNIYHVSNFIEAQQLATEITFHIVICEWDIDGINASCMVNPELEGMAYGLPVIIVVSSDYSDNSVSQAFKSGISYYYSKPYNVLPFVENINSLRSQLQVMDEMRDDNKNSFQTSSTAMTQAAIYGMGMEIIASVSSVTCKKTIARKVLSPLRLQGIHAAIAFHGENEKLECYDTDLTLCDPTTEKVFEVLKDEGRIYWFGRRLVINDKSVSLLVKNVAGDGKLLYEAILDMGAKLIPVIETRLLSIRQQEVLHSTQADVHTILGKLHSTLIQLQKEKVRIVDSVSNQINESFHRLQLTEEQEAFFVNLIDKELQQNEAGGEELLDVSRIVQEISERLIKQNALLDVNEEVEESESLSVELF